MMGQLMKPKKTEITGKRNSKACEQKPEPRALDSDVLCKAFLGLRKCLGTGSFSLVIQSLGSPLQSAAALGCSR